MSIKQTWTACIRNIRSTLNHQWSEEGQLLGVAPRVAVVLSVSEGREKGRTVRVLLTPEEAEAKSRMLLEAAKRTRESGFVERTELG